jgi:iron complex outermembrane recepter protein
MRAGLSAHTRAGAGENMKPRVVTARCSKASLRRAWLLAASASSLGAATFVAPVPVLGAEADTLQEVIVTARKREENLQEVPISIQAYSGEELKAASLQSLSDVAEFTPNLTYGQDAQSGNSAGQVFIRGVGQQDTLSTFNPGVGIYVDGVYLGRETANDLDMADVDRVEVLYGPQGTLFGRNTNGGAINVVTRAPDLHNTSADMELDTGDFDRFDALGTVNVPLANDVAALEISATRRSQRGYSYRIDGEDQANQNETSGRVQLLLKPSDSFSARLSFDGTTFNEHSAAFKLVEVRTSSTVPVLYALFTPYRYNDQWVTDSDFTYDGTGPNRNSGIVGGASATLTWNEAWGVVKSISAYRAFNVQNDIDPDGSPLTVLDEFNPIEQHQISQEFQVTGTSFSDRLHWVGGLYYFTETAQDDNGFNVALEFFHGAANFAQNEHVVNQNYSAYGQATFDWTDKLKLTLGGRVGNDRAEVGRIQVGYPDESVVQQPFIYRSANWTSFLPRISLDYHWTPDVMTYVSAAEGSKAGGFNGRASSILEFNEFEPERVWTYEVGVRSDWLDKHLRLNATVFYSDYKDFQIQINESITDPTTGQPVPYSVVGNMPKATIKGGELSLAAVPVEGLQLLGGLGITDGKYNTVIPGAPVTTNDEFVNTPKVTTDAGVEYTAPVWKDDELVTRLDYVHKTTIQYDYGNSPLVAQPGFGLLNARLTLQTMDSHLSWSLFGTNVTNVHYAVGGHDDGAGGSLGFVIKQMGPPREWGITGRYRF